VCGSLTAHRRFDLQLVGFGLMSVYHGLNEYCSVQEMHNGFKVLADIIHTLDGQA
jgi:acetylornithine deacetylase